MKLFKKQITDVYVQGMWSSQWRRDKYVVWMKHAKVLFGIKFIENTEVAAIFDTKQEARKYAKHMRHKHNVPKKYGQKH
jgi:hypothetical protein